MPLLCQQINITVTVVTQIPRTITGANGSHLLCVNVFPGVEIFELHTLCEIL